MKNITLSIDEGILHEARKYAAERNTTVNAMVREFLTEITGRESRVKDAVKRLTALSEEADLKVGSRSWTRDELHER